MKAILEYELPQESEEYTSAYRGADYRCALWELDEYLRSNIKYTEMTDEQRGVYEAVRARLQELLLDGDLTL